MSPCVCVCVCVSGWQVPRKSSLPSSPRTPRKKERNKSLSLTKRSIDKVIKREKKEIRKAEKHDKKRSSRQFRSVLLFLIDSSSSLLYLWCVAVYFCCDCILFLLRLYSIINSHFTVTWECWKEIVWIVYKNAHSHHEVFILIADVALFLTCTVVTRSLTFLFSVTFSSLSLLSNLPSDFPLSFMCQYRCSLWVDVVVFMTEIAKLKSHLVWLYCSSGAQRKWGPAVVLVIPQCWDTVVFIRVEICVLVLWLLMLSFCRRMAFQKAANNIQTSSCNTSTSSSPR